MSENNLTHRKVFLVRQLTHVEMKMLISLISLSFQFNKIFALKRLTESEIQNL